MQTTHKISGDAAAGYAAYVTSVSSRGDYYTSGDGSTAMTPSRWHGSPQLLAELGLSPDGPVERHELVSLMRGVSPADGRELRRVGGDGTRVAAIDLTFSAPKSVSALWAVSSPYERARIEAAHSNALAGAIARIERDVELLRTRVDGELRFEKAKRLLAAEFVHTSSRLTRDQESGGVPDPQLHSHLLVLGAERMNGRCAAVESRELLRSARVNGAWYRAELAHGLQELGLEVAIRTGKDGRYFELAGVPPALSERWSMRGVEIERRARAFRTRYGRDPRAGELASITLATRGTKTRAVSVDVGQAWRAVGEEYGLSRERAQGLYSSREHELLAQHDLAGDLLRDLTNERSTVTDRELRARAYELSAGVVHPQKADLTVAQLTRAGELASITLATRGTKTRAPSVDVDQAWRAVGEEYGLSRELARSLYSNRERLRRVGPDPAHALLHDLTRERSTVTDRELRGRAYELSAGVVHPREADRIVEELARTGELVALEEGLWTTRELRERERAALELAKARARRVVAPLREESLRAARVEVQREAGVTLSAEQREVVETLTGPGAVSILVGQAGTGKGVVIRAAADAWRRDGYEVIGTAIAGATAQRLRADARLEHAMTADALLARTQSGSVRLNDRTVIVMDEAGMADTNRLASVTELSARHETKLVLVGDHAQLQAIGAGGMFRTLQEHVPTAEITQVHRARHAWEREAWQRIRSGDAERALASYQARGRLHISDTRQEAAEQMVADWDRAWRENPSERTVMLTDASNIELDRINALAQERRARAGELGAHTVELRDRPYGLSAGDEVIFTAPHYSPGQERVENGTLGMVIDAGRDNEMTIKTAGSVGREVVVNTEEFGDLRLSYAQHVYKAQGRTVERAFVLTGGWQTDREHAYVALTRAQERTDVYVSREDLGEQGLDAGAIERLGVVPKHVRQLRHPGPLGG